MALTVRWAINNNFFFQSSSTQHKLMHNNFFFPCDILMLLFPRVIVILPHPGSSYHPLGASISWGAVRVGHHMATEQKAIRRFWDHSGIQWGLLRPVLTVSCWCSLTETSTLEKWPTTPLWIWRLTWTCHLHRRGQETENEVTHRSGHKEPPNPRYFFCNAWLARTGSDNDDAKEI